MMNSVLTLLLAFTLPMATLDKAFESLEVGDFAASALLLDAAAAEDPEGFLLNNLQYLRGHIAIKQQDWSRAEIEFLKVPPDSVLYDLSLWQRARVALKQGRGQVAVGLLDALGPEFPETLRLQLADEAEDEVALVIYRSGSSREAHWKQASLLNEESALWSLLTERRGDEVSLKAAERLEGRPASPTETLNLAKTFYAHRFFGKSENLYASLIGDRSQIGAEAHYELGRTYFQMGRYDDAIAVYRATVARFPDTDWERQADSQIPPSYWRQLRYAEAIEAYRALIEKYSSDRDVYHSAVRDIVDVYRAMGDIEMAERWIDAALGKNPNPRRRAILIFSRAKIQYNNGRFEEALASFRQLRGMRTGQAANGTDPEEVRFLEAASLEQLGRVEEAARIWRELSSDGFSYYGLQSLAKLNELGADLPPTNVLYKTFQSAMDRPVIELCRRPSNSDAAARVRERRLSRTRGLRTPESSEGDLVGELVFLRQWEEAFFWANRVASRWKDEALADLAYLASDFRRSMLYADRLRPPDDKRFFSLDSQYSSETRVLMEMLYPTAYADLVCREAEAAGVDPLWLYAIIWQESRYDPAARSPAAARGLMQFIPETAARIAESLGMSNFTLEDLYNPEVSIRLGAHYWAELVDQLGSAELALAAYNGGPQNVQRWQAKLERAETGWFVSEIGFAQTKAYVREVFALYAKYAHLL